MCHPSPMDNDDVENLDWRRLGRAILTRRNRLGLTQEDIAGEGGPSHATIRRLERGEPGPFQSRTLDRLEQVLNWKVGVIDAILRGTAGDDENAWVSDHVRIRENMQTVGMALNHVIRGTFEPRTVTDSATADDTVHAHAATATGTAQVGNATITTEPTDAAQHLKQVIAAARMVFALAPTPATNVAKQAMNEAVHEAMQATGDN